MKSTKNQIYVPKSSFLSIEKDFSLIVKNILEDVELKKILYYNVTDYNAKENLTDEQSFSLIGNQVRYIPKLDIDPLLKTYIIIGFDNFFENVENPEFRDNTITFDVICDYDIWNLGNFRLRPYRIAGLLDSMIRDNRLSGLGETQFINGKMLYLSNEVGGISLAYQVLHGGEDNFYPLS